MSHWDPVLKRRVKNSQKINYVTKTEKDLINKSRNEKEDKLQKDLNTYLFKPVIAAGILTAAGMTLPAIAVATATSKLNQIITKETGLPVELMNNANFVDFAKKTGAKYVISAAEQIPTIILNSVKKKEEFSTESLTEAQDLIKASYKSQAVADTILDKYGYKRLENVSTMDTKVYLKDGVPTILHRGSTTMKDWADDLLLGIGAPTTLRKKRVETLIQNLEQKYGATNSIGHSLGGYLAENTGSTGNITTFNKFATIFEKDKILSNKQTDYYNEGDWASAIGIYSQLGGKRQKIKNFTFNPLEAHKYN